MHPEAANRAAPERPSSDAETIIRTLGAEALVDRLFAEYEAYAAELGEADDDPVATLRRIRRFLKSKKQDVGGLMRGSALENRDCVTKSVLGAALANRLGVSVTIGRPKKLMNHFHTLLILPDGSFFKMAGSERDYEVVPLTAGDVLGRLSIAAPVGSALKRLRGE